MFETAPPSDKTFLLPSLRNAVVSALRTLNEATSVVTPATGYALPPTTTFDVSTAEDKERIASSLRYAEAAVTMFETAPPSDKTFLLPSLRNAVVSVLTTIDEVIGVTKR